jgi:hypothetical protein
MILPLELVFPICGVKLVVNRGARYLMGDNLKVVCAKFSNLS